MDVSFWETMTAKDWSRMDVVDECRDFMTSMRAGHVLKLATMDRVEDVEQLHVCLCNFGFIVQFWFHF